MKKKNFVFAKFLLCQSIFTLLIFLDIFFDLAEKFWNISNPFEGLLSLFLEGIILIFGILATREIYILYKSEKKSKNEVENKYLSQKQKLDRLEGEFAELTNSEYKKWELTESEKEVADFILQGLEFQDIAQKRFCSEKTIRNHAKSIYKKSGCSGRVKLSAHFSML